MHKKPVLSLTLTVCLLVQALPVTAQDKTESMTGPLRRAITREAVRLAVARERTRPDVGGVQQEGTSEQADWSGYAALARGPFATAPVRERVRFGHVAATTATRQAQPGKRPGWFKRHTVLGCTLIGAAVGGTWAGVKSRGGSLPERGQPPPPGFSMSGVGIPLGIFLGAGAGALAGVFVVLSR